MKRIQLMGPVFFRLILIIVLGRGCAGLTNPYWGMGVVILGFFAEILMHLNYIARLAHWLDDSVSVTRADAAEVPDAAMGLWADIFARVYKTRRAFDKNARRLEEREARYKKTLGALPEGILLLKRDWVLSWCNANAEAIFGVSGENDVGRHVFALVPDETLVAYLKAGHYETPLIWPKAGTDKTYEIRVVVADRKNALLIARDVTEQEKLDAMRRDFVANVSHELRTPLTVLNGFLDMAVSGVSGKAELQPQHLELMREQALRMQRLIDDLLTLSRLESGSTDKKSETVALHELVSTVTEEMQVVAKNRHTVDCSVVPVWLNGYSDEIRSVVVNLMTNAVRYTPPGGHIHATVAVTPEGQAVVSVSDNGIGIDKKDLPRLTERFYRVDKSRSRNTGGTGLGLAIVKHVLLHHNAQMKIESELGKGSTFTVVFPAERVSTKAAADVIDVAAKEKAPAAAASAS